MLPITSLAVLFLTLTGDPVRVTYTADTLVPLYQNGDLAGYPQLFNPSVTLVDGKKIHPHGSPNNHAPWLTPGGVPEAVKITSIKELELPANTRIKVQITNGRLPENYLASNKLYSWTFPVGTVARIRLFTAGQEFARHISTKVREGQGIDCWDGEEEVVGVLPDWYVSPSNCTDCHKDIGKHARVLRPNEQNYYNWLRGSDGRFSWHPFKTINPRAQTAQKLEVMKTEYVQ